MADYTRLKMASAASADNTMTIKRREVDKSYLDHICIELWENQCKTTKIIRVKPLCISIAVKYIQR